jgi:hypothetical protein
VSEAAERTKGVGAAFIKELMRRVAQASIARDGGATVEAISAKRWTICCSREAGSTSNYWAARARSAADDCHRRARSALMRCG